MRPVFLIALALMGCVPAPPATTPADKSLVITPALAAPGRSLLAMVVPYTRLDVATLVLTLRVREGDTETPVASQSLSQAQLDGTVTFAHLRPHRTYRVRAAAYKADGTLISVEAASFVDLTLTDDDAPTLATIPVRLQDVTFDGRANSGPVAVTDGGLVPAGVETIGQPAP